MDKTVSPKPDRVVTRQTSPSRARVSIVRANDYDLAVLGAAVARALEHIGGLEGLVKAGDKVFVKINHLSPPSPPERGIVTHPVFAEAVIELLKRTGAEITVGDDIDSGTRDGFSLSGFRQMCQRAGVRLVNLREAGFVATPCNGRLLDQVYLARAALEADVIVNLAKLKTHSLTVFTGAVKNMYGAIPASFRSRFHGEYPKSEDFSLMLTDVFSAVKPHLTIMDGVVAMEGEGPGSGGLRNLGVVLAGRDAVAVDAVAISIIGLNPADISTTRYCQERGLGVGVLDNIDVVGESIESVVVADFKLPAAASRAILRRVPPALARFLIDQRSVRPLVVQSQCTACAECVKICPTGAASIKDELARIDQAACIRCLCCHEVCRYDAIELGRPGAATMITRAVDVVKRLTRSRS